MQNIPSDSFTLNNGVQIPCPGFGTYKATDGEMCVNAVKTALNIGYKHIDTAAVYGNEVSVGRGIKESGKDRNGIFVTSKVWNTERGYDKTLRAFDKTLADLGLDYLDLYLIHWPANRKQFGDEAPKLNAETWRALEKLYRDGRVRAIGLSNFLPHHIDDLMQTAEIKPMVDQIEFHPGLTQQDCVDYCKKNGIVVEAWSALGRGRVLQDPNLLAVSERHHKTPAQAVIRWEIQKGILPLVKSTHESRIRENFDVFDFELSDEDMKVIDAIKSTVRIGAEPDECDF